MTLGGQVRAGMGVVEGWESRGDRQCRDEQEKITKGFY
jgi:hypothetical protein